MEWPPLVTRTDEDGNFQVYAFRSDECRDKWADNDTTESMDTVVECEACGFVLLAENAYEPTPKRVRSCPRCDGTDFGFTHE